MTDEANEALLNRDEAAGHAAEHYGPQLELVRQIVNYGTHLILRAYNSTDRDMAGVVVCGVLLKQVVAMLDALSLLLEAGATHAGYLPARAALEASFYIDWILLRDTDEKAKCYIVGNYRREKLWSLRATRGTPEHTAWKDFSSGPGVDWLTADTEAAAKVRLEEVRRVLSQEALKPIDDRYTKLRKNSKRDVEWYELLGAKSLYQIARDVGRLLEYQIWYDRGSIIAHSGSHEQHVAFWGGGYVSLKHIRELGHIHELVTCCVVVAVTTYRSVLRIYRHGELDAFNRKYRDEWRGIFRSMKRVTYQRQKPPGDLKG